MSTSTDTAAASPNTYLEQDLKSFQQLEGVSPQLKQAAQDALSCLSRSAITQSGQRRTKNKLRLVASSANTVDATEQDDLSAYAVQCKFRKLGAVLVNNPMNEIYRSRLEKEHNFDWKTGFRIPGPRDGASLSNNTFVSPLTDNLYRALTFNDQGEANETIIGQAGLWDRLGEPPTTAELKERQRPCGAKRANIEKTLGWVRTQSEGAFGIPQGEHNPTILYSNAASDLCALLNFPGMTVGVKPMHRKRESMLKSEFNDTFKWPARTSERRKGVFESVATIAVARAILAHVSCGGTAADLLSNRPDCSGAMLLDFEIDAEGKANIARSHWAFPSAFRTSKSADPMHHFYDSVKFHDGTVETREITAGELLGMLTEAGNPAETSVGKARSVAGSGVEESEGSQAKRRRFGK